MVPIIFKGKLHFTTQNYTPDYTLHPKLFECTLCTLNYHTYYTLHPSVTFVVMFNEMLLHMTSTCILLRWNKLKRLKHSTSKLIKQDPIFFTSLSLSLMRATSSPNPNSLLEFDLKWLWTCYSSSIYFLHQLHISYIP